MEIVSSGEPGEFPVHTAAHCRMCNFLEHLSAPDVTDVRST